MKTRIAVCAETPPGWGGSFQYATSILDAVATLDRDRYDVRIWYRHPAWQPLIAEKGLESHSFGSDFSDILYRGVSRALSRSGLRQAAPNAVWQWEKIRPVTRTIAKWRADICVNLQQTSLSLPTGIRQISPIHDLMHLYEDRFPEVAERREWLERQWIFSNIAKRCARIMVDSPTGARHVREKFDVPPNHIVVLPFIAPNTLLVAAPQRPTALPQTLKGDDYIFYPAQFWQHKNHVGLLEAMAQLRGTQIDVVFTGTTDKNGYRTFRERVDSLQLAARVHVLGYVNDSELSWLYRHARFMAMPTFLGPTNIPPLEAMSLGCAVAVSDVYGMREQLGDAALYFNPGDSSDIARALRRLWDDAVLRAHLRELGRQHVAGWNSTHFEKSVQNILTMA